MKMWSYKLFILVSCFLNCGHCYNFLGIFPIPIKSHMVIFESLMKELFRVGHNVTVVTAFANKNSLPNYRNIDIGEYVTKLVEFHNITLDEADSKVAKYLTPLMTSKMADLMCEALASPPYQSFLKENKTYNAIIVENFNSECFLSIAHKIKAPIIGISSSGILPWIYQRYGIPNNPAYIPEIFLELSDRMNFFQRVENTLMSFFHNLYHHYYRLEKDKEVVRKYVGSDATDLNRFVMNSSLLLVNTHFTLNFPRPLPPNVIEIGGIHIEEPKQLPQKLNKWIEDSPAGVIYFSMGAMTKGQTLPKKKLKDFIDAFNVLPQKIIWKWENDTMEEKSEKILIQKWLPQLDILCHPNVRLFVSHGGLLGLIEAVYCGVPVVVMPQYGDQHANAKAIEATGTGIILHISEVTVETAYTAMLKALRLRNKMRTLSNQFRDRPLSPLKSAVYWTEYVVRNNGTPFMRTAATDMPFYQYYLLDVLLFIFVTFSTVIYCLMYIAKSIFINIDKIKMYKYKKE